jgi:hypothetical protein
MKSSSPEIVHLLVIGGHYCLSALQGSFKYIGT